MSFDHKIIDLKYRINKLIPKDICHKLIETYEKYSKLSTQEESYKYEDKEIKPDNYKSLNLSRINNPNKDIENALNISKMYLSIMITNYVLYIQKNICPTFDNTSMCKSNNIRIIKYKEGECIKDHSDISGSTRASCTLNLNEDYEGGEFRFFNGQIKESFKTGDGMIFPAELVWIHGTEPVTKGTRYCINCFLSSKDTLL
jgi:predicted 2-oxoglutarate/Fe(II)-dependent dioxygenase YbiX